MTKGDTGTYYFLEKLRAVKLRHIHADKMLGTFEWVDGTGLKCTVTLELGRVDWDE